MANIDNSYSIEGGLSLDDVVGIFQGSNDPSSGIGEAAPVGSLFLRSSGQLYQKTGAADVDWELIVPTFGSNYQYAEDVGVTTTTQNQYLEKLSMVTPAVPVGVYRIGWTFQWNHNVTTNDFVGRVQLDNTTDLNVYRIEPKDAAGSFSTTGTNQRMEISGFVHVPLTAGPHQIDIDFRSSNSGVATSIWNTRIEFWRVS